MSFTRNDTTFLKGLGILLIVLHNFCHWLPNAVPENEYTFDVARIQFFSQYWRENNSYLLLQFFSHFGHYGVSIFLFISGYGLSQKYENPNNPKQSFSLFLWTHLCKLWLLLLPAVLLFILIRVYKNGVVEQSLQTFAQLFTFTANFSPTRPFIFGPWWFFSLIVQFYLLYRLIFYIWRNPWVLWSVVLLSLGIQMSAYVLDWSFIYSDKQMMLMEYLRYNAIGHLLPFALGIQVARSQVCLKKKSLIAHLFTMSLGIVLTFWSAHNSWLWFFSPLFALMATLPTVFLLSNTNIFRYGLWIGTISAPLFVFHPIVRHELILPASRALRLAEPVLVYSTISLYLLLSVLLAWSYMSISQHLYSSR